MTSIANANTVLSVRRSRSVVGVVIAACLTLSVPVGAGVLSDVANVFIPKKPSDLIPGNTPIERKLKDVVQKNAGDGEVGTFIKKRASEHAALAEKVGRETDRIHEDGKIMARGGLDAAKAAIENPKQGIPRYLACLNTACASELIAKKRADRIEQQKKDEWEARKAGFITAEKSRRKADTLSAIDASRAELLELELLQFGIQTQLNTVLAVLDMEKSKMSQDVAAVSKDLAAVSTYDNQQRVYAYLRETLVALVQAQPKSQVEISLRQKEKELSAIAEANKLEIDELMIAIVLGMDRAVYQDTLTTAKMTRGYLEAMLRDTLRQTEVTKTHLASKEAFLKELA
jgi:hypothetical protein